MKTFDKALEYLKDLDLSMLDPFDPAKEGSLGESGESMKNTIMDRESKFRMDINNSTADDHYKSTVFLCAFFHSVWKQKGLVSLWDVACEIVEANKHILEGDYEKCEGVDYPKIMIDQFLDYCASKPEIPILQPESEFRYQIIFSAYHHIIDEPKKIR